MKIRIPRPSPAMLVAILALVVATSGSAYAIQRAESGDSLVAKRTLSGNRLRLNTVTDKEVVNLQWHNLVLQHGWINYYTNQRPPAWAIDVQGVVHLRGAIEDGSEVTFAQLPLSIRPPVTLYLDTDLCSAAPGRVLVTPGGFMSVGYDDVFSDAQCFTALDGVTWTTH